jgi:hypothetical protein
VLRKLHALKRKKNSHRQRWRAKNPGKKYQVVQFGPTLLHADVSLMQDVTTLSIMVTDAVAEINRPLTVAPSVNVIAA